MRSIVVGTAGHIDHGKTALVRALTGIETDRLAEEKRRGISIDLGFAHLELAGLRLGFVDVPGHERFVKNMLAGAGGIDLVLLVIAADESIKPQTREHFQICRLLGIEKGIVVLTKSDLVEADLLDLARLEVEEFVAGSFLEGAPVVAVSSITGAGLDPLREALVRVASSVAGKDPSGYFRLPVDRSFTMRGFGAVVTGTLVSGSVRVDSEVEGQPGGRRWRVRGIQVHGQNASIAYAGQRTALNLAGADPSEVGRGTMLTEPGSFRATEVADCEFELLESAKPLKHRAPVHFHAWTAECEAQVRTFTAEMVRPGERGWVRFLLSEPAMLLPGDRFIVRMFSPVITIGGGRVLDVAPPVRRKRTDSAARLRTLASAPPAQRIALVVGESRCGMSVQELVMRTGLPRDEITRSASAASLYHLPPPQDWVLERNWMNRRAAAIEKRLAEFHRARPLAAGLAKEEVRSRELGEAPPFLLDALLAGSRAVVTEGELLRLATHQVNLQADEDEAVNRIEAAFRESGLAVPATAEVLAHCGITESRSRSLLQLLLRRGTLVRVGPDLVFHRSALDALRGLMTAHRGERFTVPAFKDWTGVSRKYAIPLLEFLDRERLTRREGDVRVVL
jgi:selenocysteine-specific elongation factor